MINIRAATLDDARYLGSRLRQQDREEVKASHGVTGEEAVLLSFQRAVVSYVVELDGQVICLFGVTQALTGGYPWLLGTDAMEQLPVTFFRTSRTFIDAFVQQFGYLENYVDARNTLSIQWLRWLGFTIYQPAPYGIEQKLFHKFTLGGD